MAGEVDVNTINDIEMLMIALIAGSNKGFKTAAEAYKLIPPGSNEMLGWKRPIEIQPLMLFDLLRVGTVGDGNCLLHSILFACSPTYRAQDARSRSALADAFRRVLCARDFELIEIADSIYGPEIGGAAALEEDFMDLHKKRDEMDVMMAPVIAHLFGHNLLAIQLREGMEMVPVRTTASGYDRTLPTILVNYLGGGLDFGNAAFADEGAGVFHYESIIWHAKLCSPDTFCSKQKVFETIIGGEGKPEKTGKAKNTTIKKAKNTVKNTTKTKAKRTTGIILNDMTTQFVFNFGDPSLESIKELFGL